MVKRFISLFLSLLSGALAAGQGTLPPLHVQGMNLVDPEGHTVLLKGINTGNWLMVEFWMLGLGDEPNMPADQFDLEALLTKRFGEAEKDRLMNVYRSSWMTERDFQNIRSFGFNVVRVPMNYRLFEDDRRPFHLRPDAFKWSDRAIDLAEKNGLYVILDMHGVQGGQNPYDHSGHANQNKLKDSPEDQKRLAWLWEELAKRYRNRSAVVAYDLMNEPYGTPKPIQASVMKQAIEEVRKRDPEKLIYVMGNYDGFDHYGNPRANGWHNVGFEMHYYPGLFGNGAPTLKTNAKHIDDLKAVAEQVRKLDVPFLVGEMNVVFDKAGGADMMRRYYDLHASYGWGTTMWSYKVDSLEGGIGVDSWAAAANRDPEPKIDFKRDSEEAIEAYFRHFATEPLAVNEKLRHALTDPNFAPAPLPQIPAKRTSTPAMDLPGWQQQDIGNPLKGGCEVLPDGVIRLYGGGSDIWGGQDQFRFLYQPVTGDFDVETTLDEVEDIDTYTKGGLMVRATMQPDAPMVLLSSFPTGELQLAHRDTASGEAAGTEAKQGSLPGVRLRLSRRGGRMSAAYADANGDWKELGSIADNLPQQVFVGVVALSHDNTQLARIVYRELRLKK